MRWIVAAIVLIGLLSAVVLVDGATDKAPSCTGCVAPYPHPIAGEPNDGPR